MKSNNNNEGAKMMKKFIYGAALFAVLFALALPASAFEVPATMANASWLTFPAAAQAVVNGQAVAVTNSLVRLVNTGTVLAQTVTNTLSAAYGSSVLAFIQADSANTNNIQILDGASGILNGNWTASANEWILLFSVGTNWTEISRSEAQAGAGSSTTIYGVAAGVEGCTTNTFLNGIRQ